MAKSIFQTMQDSVQPPMDEETPPVEEAAPTPTKPVFSVPGPADKPVKASSKELIDAMVAKDELPDNPVVIKALIDGKANINIVKADCVV